MADMRPIGVMDSGMGGLSVLQTLRDELPEERFVYWGDNRNAPYGTKDVEEIRRLTVDCVQRLLDADAKAVVIACNTATSAAAAYLRERLSLPVFGLEPALKPAEEYAGEGRVAVLATEATLRLEKYQKLLKLYGRNTVNLPTPELVEFVEAGELDSPRLRAYLRDRLEPYREDLSAVVLGCTHFVWLRGVVQEVVPERVKVFDGNEGLARHVRAVLDERGLLSPKGSVGGCELHSTSDDSCVLARMRELLSR